MFNIIEIVLTGEGNSLDKESSKIVSDDSQSGSGIGDG